MRTALFPDDEATTSFTCSCFLDRRAWHAPVGTEDAAVARFRRHGIAAFLALVSDEAGVRRHSLLRTETAFRACQHGIQLDAHRRSPATKLAVR